MPGLRPSVTQAQSQLPSLIKEAEEGTPVRIRRRDETVAFPVSRERMEAIVETSMLDLLEGEVIADAEDDHAALRRELIPRSAPPLVRLLQ